MLRDVMRETREFPNIPYEGHEEELPQAKKPKANSPTQIFPEYLYSRLNS